MENQNPPTLTKTCSSCGIQKPLSVFLELSGDNAGTYGSICGSCRKASQTKITPKDVEDGSRTSTGNKIDSKAKVAGDIDKKELKDRTEEDYHEERDEDEIIAAKIDEKKDNKSKDERKHREGFLNKRSFISDKNKTGTQAPKTHIATQEEAKQARNESENAREEQKKSEFDFTGPVIDTQIAGKQKFSGVAIRQFATWVGNSSAVGRALGQGQKPATPSENNKDATLSEMVEKTWGPGSKR